MQKMISPERDRRQSEWLVLILGIGLASLLGLQIFFVVGMGAAPRWFLYALIGSAGFAVLVWKMRASTAWGAALGGVICLKLLMKIRFDEPWTRTALPELVALFVMTFAATRFGKTRGVVEAVEERRGRQASQVAANLGFAGLMAGSVELGIFLAGLAALAEAAADTVSSEVGRALGGATIEITTGRKVEPGRDGGVSLAGSLAGIGAAGVVAIIAVWLGAVDGMSGAVVFTAGCAGLVFDSLLGATVERLGWIGNDLVNFTSTCFAGAIAYEVSRFVVPPQPYW